MRFYHVSVHVYKTVSVFFMIHTKKNNLVITVLLVNIKTILYIIIRDNNIPFLS
jgi:hypothetical protein